MPLPRCSSRRIGRNALGFIVVAAIAVITGCAQNQFSHSRWNPFGLTPLFGSDESALRIAMLDSVEGVFDTAEWAFIKRRPPWEPLGRAVSQSIGRPVRFELLEDFQIEYQLANGVAQFAFVSGEVYESLRNNGIDMEVLAEGEVLRRQGIVVANARSGIRSLEDIRGKRFAFGPRTDPVLFYKTLELLDRSGITPSDIEPELALVGFDGVLQHHPTSRRAAREIVYGLGTDVGVLESTEYAGFPETGGRWLPLAYTFSKDQFVVLGKTDSVEAVTLQDAKFVSSTGAPEDLVNEIRACLFSAHVKAPQALHALGYSRFRPPLLETPPPPAHTSASHGSESSTSTDELARKGQGQ